MPQRSNDFQRLIAKVYQQITGNDGRVTESAMVYDKDADTVREVDILVEQRVAHHDIRIMIECRDRARKDCSTWIDEIIGKSKSLSIDKVVAVSKSGFSKGALNKAAANGIVTLTVEAALETDWSALSFKPGIALVTNETFRLQDIQYLEGNEFLPLESLGLDSRVIQAERELGSVKEVFTEFFRYEAQKLQEKVNEQRQVLFQTLEDFKKTLLIEHEYDMVDLSIKECVGKLTKITKLKFMVTGNRQVLTVEQKHEKFNDLMISTGQHALAEGSVIKFQLTQDPEANQLYGSWEIIRKE